MKKPERLSKYISYNEAVRSSTALRRGIDNTPKPEHLENMVNLAKNFFDPLREFFDVPLYVSSFYRCKELNKAVGGARYSDHMANGSMAAIDIDADRFGGVTNLELFNYIKDNMNYYKLIAEYPVDGQPKWIHVSFSTKDSYNEERRTLIAVSDEGRTGYIHYKGNEHLLGL